LPVLRPAVVARPATAAVRPLAPPLHTLGAELLERFLLLGGEQAEHLLACRAVVRADLLEQRADLRALLLRQPRHPAASPRPLAALARLRRAGDRADLLHQRAVLLHQLSADLLELRLLLGRQLE